ncbi:hypothetical protein KP509_07G096000 [Ceratopteris richardii]|uniref:At1g04390 ARM repeat domain-containing protein n=1 Tax=Ceratopteris richardii TaxID=49495 RepID=A0A8T2UKJ3_CERRI|nr:hypothetical protein KP509_07G096000 [Ceratopteris richardii]
MSAASPTKAQEDRLRRVLSLGLKACTTRQKSLNGSFCFLSKPMPHTRRYKTWWNTDAEVQGQAIRAIQAFVSACKGRVQTIEKILLDDIISALEGLLKVAPEQLQSLAADITADILATSGSVFLGSRVQGLCASLVQLFSYTRSSSSCAVALRIMINDASKLSTNLDEKDFWAILKEGNILDIVRNRLQAHAVFDGEGVPAYVSLAELCTAILHWRSMERFNLGSNVKFRKCILHHARSSNEAVCCAALRLYAALALCGGVALLQIQDTEDLCRCLVANTEVSKSSNVRTEAFHLLSVLSRSINLGTYLSETVADTICTNINKTIMEQPLLSNTRWTPKTEKKLMEVVQAAKGLAYLPGSHHHSIGKTELTTSISALLLELYDIGSISYPKATKYDKMFAPHLWDALSWIFIYAPAENEEAYRRISQQDGLLSKLINFAW